MLRGLCWCAYEYINALFYIIAVLESFIVITYVSYVDETSTKKTIVIRVTE